VLHLFAPCGVVKLADDLVMHIYYVGRAVEDRHRAQQADPHLVR
jgi:hypothetical protein